ncbi:MAG: CBS domain-containing protein [Pirellulales bacterium]|nr:CBS domain-containing protein [Pirellulales bacterium]
MLKNAIFWLSGAAVAATWALFLLDEHALDQAIQFVKSQRRLELTLASFVALTVGAAGFLLPRSAGSAPKQVGDTSSPDAQAVVTPKRVANRKLEVHDLIMQDMSAILSSGLEVRHLMSEELHSVQPDTKLAEVRRLMQEEGIRHLPVSKAGEYGHIAGIISDRDLASRPGGYAQDIMTPAPVTICHGAKIQQAVDLMADRGFNSLLVKRGELTCGIITTTDLIIGLRATYEMLRMLVPDEDLAAASAIAQ